MSDLHAGHRAMGFQKSGDGFERVGVLGRPDAEIAVGDAAAFFHRGGLAEDQPGTAQRELAEMHLVPLVSQTLAGGVLAHRRYDDAIVQRHAAHGHR
jgi:hypothetical protein